MIGILELPPETPDTALIGRDPPRILPMATASPQRPAPAQPLARTFAVTCALSVASARSVGKAIETKRRRLADIRALQPKPMADEELILDEGDHHRHAVPSTPPRRPLRT